MSTSISTCANLEPNCDKGKLPIGDTCYPYAKTSSPQEEGIVYSLNGTDMYGTVLANESAASVYECLRKCNQNDTCNLSKYNFDKGECTLLTQGNQGGQTVLVSKNDPQDCVNVYTRQGGTDKDSLNILQESNDNIFVSFKGGTPTKNVKKIEGNYIGTECRQEVATNTYDPASHDDVLQGMADFCKNHSDFKVCNEFCKNSTYSDYCPQKKKTLLLIFSGLFFLFLFLSILTLVKKKKIYLLFGFLTLISLGLAIWRLIIFLHSDTYIGDKPDFVSTIPSIKKECAKMAYYCNDPQQPLGKRCKLSTGGSGAVIGKDKCENIGCCLPGYLPKNGVCTQVQNETGNITWTPAESPPNGPGGYIASCSSGYIPQNGAIPSCIRQEMHTGEGALYCGGGSDPKWIKCGKPLGCGQPFITYYAPTFLPDTKNPPRTGRGVKLKLCK